MISANEVLTTSIRNPLEEAEAVSWSCWLSFLSIAELPLTELPASLSHCRQFSIVGYTIAVSVGNGLSARCSPQYSNSTLFSLSQSREAAHLQTRDSERHLETTMLRSEIGEGQPRCQRERLSELKQHVTVY